MDESKAPLFEPNFNGSVKVAATDERLTSDAGLILMRHANRVWCKNSA